MGKLLILAAVMAMTGTAQATLLAYEGFDYSDGTTVLSGTLTGGYGFGGAWLSTDGAGANPLYIVTTDTVTWGALEQSGNRLHRTSTAKIEAVSRVATNDWTTGNTELWFSVIYDADSNSGFTLASEPSGDDQYTTISGPGFGIYHGSTGIRAATYDATGTRTISGVGSSPLITETEYFLVGKIEFNVPGAGGDVYSLYNVGTDLVLGSPLFVMTNNVDENALDTVTFGTNRGPGYDEIRVGTTEADVIKTSAVFAFNLTPADQQTIAVDYPAVVATNSITAEYANSTLGVEIMALNVTGDSNAFSAVTSTPFTNSTPTPATVPLEFAFDASEVKPITGTNGGFNVNGSVDVIWRNLDGGAVSTNTVALKGNYSNPVFGFTINSSLGMTLVAPATVVSNDITVSYVEGRPGHTNVEIVAVNVLNESHAGSYSAINPGVIQNPEPSNDVITVIFNNGVAGLGNKEGATADLEVIYGEVGGSVTSTSTVPVSTFNYDLPSDAVVQQVFGSPVEVQLGVGSGLVNMNDFGSYSNKWNANQNLSLVESEGAIKLTSGGNTRSAYNLIEANTAGSDNFGAVDTHILTNGLYRYDFDYEVLNYEGATTLWSFNAYALIDQQDFPVSNNNNKVQLDVATGTTGGVDVDIRNDGNAYYSQHADGTLGGTSDVARATGTVWLNVQDNQDALFVMHRSGKCTVRLYDLVLTRVGDYEVPLSPANAVLDATFTDASTTNSMLHDPLYDYNDAGANQWAYGASAKWKNRALQNVSNPDNSRSIAIVTRAGTAGYDDVGVQDTIALTGGVYTVSLDVNFAAVTNVGHGSVTVFSFAGVDSTTGNVNDVRLDLSEGTNVASAIEASQVPKLRGNVIFSELARRDYSNDVSETLVFTDLAVQDGEDLAIRITSYLNADFNKIDNVQVLRTGDAPLVGYAAWVDTYGLTGNDALLTTDVEPDGLDNLLEYALNGDPNADDGSGKPGTFTAMDAGTNWFYHVHNERTDDPRLSYSLGRKENLVYGTNWTTGAIKYVGESAVVDNIKSVTNRTDVGDKEFIRLKVDLLE